MPMTDWDGPHLSVVRGSKMWRHQGISWYRLGRFDVVGQGPFIEEKDGEFYAGVATNGWFDLATMIAGPFETFEGAEVGCKLIEATDG